MAMALKFLTCLVLTVYIVASVDATISCGTVVTNLFPCDTYFSKGEEVPSSSCCDGVRNVNDMAQTTADRQQTCKCIQSFAKSIPDLDPSLATGLPEKCGVEVPYSISLDTNCDELKHGLAAY